MLNNIYKFFSYDSLTVYDGDSNGSPMLGKYCGTSIPPSHISSNNNIFIHFDTDGYQTKTGFKLEYHPSNNNQQTCLAGVHALVGDGYCHDEVNNLEYNYDGGDCCLPPLNLDHCSSCICQHESCADGTNPLVENGYCNDETNNVNCNYDGGDCCVNVHTFHCSECSCLGGGVIDEYGFYYNNLDKTWLIQASLGQLIKLSFLNFDVQFHSSCR